MKTITPYLLILATITFSYAQHKDSTESSSGCNISEAEMTTDQQAQFMEFLLDTNEDTEIGDFAIPQKKAASYVIPVVFHVIYSGQETNVSDDAIVNYLAQLNTNVSTVNLADIRPEFQSIAKTTNLEFRMATFDNDGYPINGLAITRHQDTHFIHTDFTDLQEQIYKYGWDSKKYMNVYIVPRLYEALGSAIFPLKLRPLAGNPYYNTDQHPFLDGIFLLSKLFGVEFTEPYDPAPPLPDARSSTIFAHEVGHWLGLFHVYQNGCNYPGDYVDDTPYQTYTGNFYFGDNTCAEGLGDLPDMAENFMAVSDVRAMFTSDQVDRMYYWLQNDAKRSEIIVSDRAEPIDPSTIYANFEMNGATYVPSGGLDGQMPTGWGSWNSYEVYEDELVEFNGTYFSNCLGGEVSYTWSIISEDGLVESYFNEPDFSLYFLHPSTYEITLTVSSLCDSGQVTKQLIVRPSAIVAEVITDPMVISPNAVLANQSLKISKVNNPSEFKIISLDGNIIQMGKLKDQNSIPIGSIKAGVYVLHVIEGNGNVYMEQLIIKN